jgi:hypothetical protein
MYCKNVKFGSQFYSRAPVLNFDRLRYGSLRFLTRCGLPTVVPEASCWVLSFSEIPARCGLPTVIPLIRKFCSAPAETFSNSKVDGELPGQDVADMYHLDSETSHGDSTLGAIRKGSNKQGPKNHPGTKADISVPRATHYHEKEWPSRVQPYLFQIVLDTPRYFLVDVLDKWILR